MKDRKRLMSILSAGFNTELATKAVNKNYTYSKLQNSTKTDLKQDFYEHEVNEIIRLTKRQPIEESTMLQLIRDCDWKCCICWDVLKEEPVILHHIEEHSKTRDDSYENLVVLCLTHHALAHSKWEISRHPLPKALIKQRKKEFAGALSEYKKGLRSAPGQERKETDPFSHSDAEAIKYFCLIIDRPALRTPLSIEGNMNDFLKAIEDVIRAFNTGILITRDNHIIAKTKPKSMLSNPNWNEKMRIITGRLEEIINRIRIAVLDNEMLLQPDGFFAFHSNALPLEIDSLRESIFLLFNKILEDAGLPMLNHESLNLRNHR
ncbi:HNH endonuclease [Pedobacter sp. SG918]|uniref:HNH endonuclease n=1 Tax=Pedobacter sp. SG918 TaxID=2587136 RepID=UPI00146E5D9C|nr:HNH endonuclease signature motif containing protein [Pedobacter sp. SG918]NMN37736.1 hypothetical protein [Pedobacter sp. SG918]